MRTDAVTYKDIALIRTLCIFCIPIFTCGNSNRVISSSKAERTTPTVPTLKLLKRLYFDDEESNQM